MQSEPTGSRNAESSPQKRQLCAYDELTWGKVLVRAVRGTTSAVRPRGIAVHSPFGSVQAAAEISRCTCPLYSCGTTSLPLCCRIRVAMPIYAPRTQSEADTWALGTMHQALERNAGIDKDFLRLMPFGTNAGQLDIELSEAQLPLHTALGRFCSDAAKRQAAH